MTRKEQIIAKASKNSENFYKVNDNYGHCFHGGFIDGAEWADSNPNPEIIKRVLLYALQHTNILLADDWDEVRWSLLIKKAMEE